MSQSYLNNFNPSPESLGIRAKMQLTFQQDKPKTNILASRALAIIATVEYCALCYRRSDKVMSRREICGVGVVGRRERGVVRRGSGKT
ncbi:hypothetical protein J6590_046264 [Homalodisca vitripennis]|nr:hypothetical protein J6590_046264 [Homalodisca vitripennis]